MERNKILKIIFSIVGGLVCGFLAYLLLGLIVLGLTINNPTLFIILAIAVFLISCSLFIWTFINSPNIKKMWGRICISIGSIILLFPLSIFIMMMSLTTNLSKDTDIMGLMILSSMGGSICIGIFCFFMAISFIIGAYFLLKKD